MFPVLDIAGIRIVHHLTVASLIIMIPYLVHKILNVRIRKVFGIILGLFAGYCVVLIFLPYYFTPVGKGIVEMTYLRYIGYALIILVLIYSEVLCILCYRDLLNQEIRIIVRNTMTIFAVSIPLLGLDVVLRLFFPWIQTGVTTLPMVFFVWNLMSLILFARLYFFKLPPEPKLIRDIPENLQAEYSITAREKEIILLLAGGLVSKDISRKLDISERTVRNHIYNIYQKLNVQGRFEMLMKIQKGAA